jgi:hypothetical protein
MIARVIGDTGHDQLDCGSSNSDALQMRRAACWCEAINNLITIARPRSTKPNKLSKAPFATATAQNAFFYVYYMHMFIILSVCALLTEAYFARLLGR